MIILQNNPSKNNYIDCLNFMANHSFNLNKEFIVDGDIHRFSKDEHPTKKDEWYISHEGIGSKGNSYLCCTFGSWKTDEKYTYRSWDNDDSFSHDEKKKLYELHIKKEQEALKVLHEEAAREANDIWNQASYQASSEEYTYYLNKKEIDPVCVKFGLNPNGYPSMIIPFYDIDENIRTLQFISTNLTTGETYKTFLSGGEKKGNFCILKYSKDWSNKDLYICEGYATGVSVFMAKKEECCNVIIAGDAGNIPVVVKNIRSKFKKNKIVIAADNDAKGISKAEEAAKKYNCTIAIPEFPDEKSSDSNGKKYTDFNDVHCVLGLEEVKKQLNLQNRKNKQNSNKKDNAYLNFSLDNNPTIIQEYVRTICTTTDADSLIVLSSVLTMISAFMGKKVYLKNYFQKLYPNLWILTIAKSGQFKSTALNKGAKIALRKSSEIAKQIKELQKELKTTLDNNRRNEISEEIEQLKLENPILPTKTTAEGLLESLSEGRSGLILSNELSAWLQNLEKKYNNDLKGMLTDFYDVNVIYEYKTKTQGEIIIENPFISICGVSPFVGIKSNLNLNDVSSGFFARFLIITPAEKNVIPQALPNNNTYFDIETENSLKDILFSLNEFFEDEIAYELSEEAKEYFEKIHERMYQKQEKCDDVCREILDPFLKRWSPYILKIAMIMQFIEDQETRIINKKAINRAARFIKVALESTTKLYEGELAESSTQRRCRIVYEFILKKYHENNCPVSRKIILSSKKLKGGSKEYDYILETLEDQDTLEVDKKSPKKNEWEYIPKKLN